MADTPGLLPTLSGDTSIKTKAGVLIAVIGGVSVAVWSWAEIYYGQRDLARATESNTKQIEAIAIEQKETTKQVQDLRLELARLGMVSKPSPISGQ